jgi:hypothetical protein
VRIVSQKIKYTKYPDLPQKAIFAKLMSVSGKFIPNFSSLHRFACYAATIFIIFITNNGYSQSKTDHAGSGLHQSSDAARKATGKDTSGVVADTLKLNGSLAKKDTTGGDSTAVADTSKRNLLEQSLGIKISKDAMAAVVKAKARDSAVLDMDRDLFYLYGKAQVNYEDLQLNAGQVSFQQSSSTVSAAPFAQGKGSDTEKQTFTQGKEHFAYDSMQYNFKSKRAIVRNVHSQYGEGFVYSEQVKRNPDQSIYGLHSIYTTCALDTPHFGIVATKIKVIPGKVIVTGSANLVIEGVPTPLFLPFGLFPVTDKQKSGFVIPTYTIEEQRGLGLLNGGYYWYVNDHIDMLTQANIYTKGSYALSEASTYGDIYHYRGAFRLSYAYNKTGEDYEPKASVTKDYRINWSHQSDAKAVPGQSFNALVDLGSSTYYSNNSYDPNQILQNQYQSNVTYSKSWQGRPYSLTMSGLYNQNTQNKQVSVTLPSMSFNVSQFNPFQKKTAVGTHWYDKITASYTANIQNRTTFYDTAFSLTNQSINNFQSGVHHSIPVSASYTILRYVNMSFSVNYNEYWLTNRLYEGYSTADNKIDSTNQFGFFTARDFNAGVNFSTRIYGMKLFKTGKLRGIRHVITPNIGFVYHPDFGASPYNYYYRTRLDTSQAIYTLSPFATSIVGSPPQGKAANVNFAINNNLQIKVRSSKDTVSGFKNVTLIDGFGIATAYNAAADSFQWSPIGVNFRTNVLDKVNISGTANYDPYAFDYFNGIRTKELMIDKGTGAGRFTSGSVALGSNFHSKTKAGANSPTNSEEYTRIIRNAGYNDYVDFNVPWSFNISYALNANSTYTAFSKRDTTTLTQSLMFQGELQVTTRWKVNISSGYDFQYKQLTSTSIDVYRDLHCWAMHLQTIPFGPRKSFNFTLNVKSAILQDLKLMRRRDYRDAPI